MNFCLNKKKCMAKPIQYCKVKNNNNNNKIKILLLLKKRKEN